MFLNVINSIGDLYPSGSTIYNTISIIMAILVAYKTIYFVVGFFFTRKFKPAKKKHKYAILIAARNEKNVIGNLLDSIKKQDYPKKNITVFVVADNCTDNTAQIAREHGAIVYERYNDTNKTKGYALEFLLDNIEQDYGRLSFEGYFIFDADNLLNKNYISKMNDAFDSGEKIITSYRNTKNFDENWIASTYALHWIRSIRTNHRARSVFRLATNIQGTGFLFASEIVKDGWHYTSLTEDRALTADAVVKGYSITYNDEAEFFDEQPISLKIALRQRLRWSKGHLLAFAETAPKLFVNTILGKVYVIDSNRVKKNGLLANILESIRHRFASYDMLMQQMPVSIINLARWLLISLILYGFYSYSNGVNDLYLFSGNSILRSILSKIFGNEAINITPGINALFISMITAIWFRFRFRIETYFASSFIAIYLFIVENHRIKKISLGKKIIYTLTWPIFDIIGRYTSYVALFTNVTWKPIPHNSKVTIDDVDTSKNGA
jgi:cellulose synthase/poly-beta-1,6-N-acetylglucosamine synthase-like glycosyltransferase